MSGGAGGKGASAGDQELGKVIGSAKDEEAEGRKAPAPEPTMPDESADRASKLHAEARRLAKLGQCDKALKLASEIRRIDGRYYDEQVVGDAELRKCSRTPRSKKRPSKLPISK
jgi:hypothetical protein